MNLKKNAGAKIGAVVASLVALLIGWGLVHQNPPVPVAADTAASTASGAPAQNAGSANSTAPRTGSSASRSAAPMAPKRHVRTHVS